MRGKMVLHEDIYRLFNKHFVCLTVIVLAALLLQSACQNENSSANSGSTPINPQTQLPTGATAAGEPEDGQWLMAAKNYANTRFSGLDQINASNVGNLKVAWTFSTGINRGQEAAPLVVGETTYVVTP